MKIVTRDNPQSTTRTSMQSPQKSKGLDALKQLVLLTKQNKYLREEVEHLREQIKSIVILKAKYKDKYKKLKQEVMLSKPLTSDRKQTSRSKSGKIYRQHKLMNEFSQQQHHTQRDYSKFQNANGSNDDPYGMNQKQRSQLGKISMGIENIINLLSNIRSRSDQQYTQVCKNTEKLQCIAQLISEKIRQSKDTLNKFDEVQVKRQTVTFHPKIQAPSTYTSEQDNLQLKQQASGEKPPQKDSKNYERTEMRERRARGISQKNSEFKIKGIRSRKEQKRQESSPEAEEDNYSSDNEESTKSKWQMINEIGRKLKNWRFSTLDEEIEHNIG